MSVFFGPKTKTALKKAKKMKKKTDLAAQGRRPDLGAGRQLRQRFVPGRNEGVAHVLAGQVAGQDRAGGEVGGDVLRGGERERERKRGGGGWMDGGEVVVVGRW